MPLDARPPDPGQAWAATEAAWSAVVPACEDLIAERDARHAYAVLRGLTSGTGAMVAAATTSLPERLEAGRNYDYRYSWIRDQCYAGLAVAAHGPHPLLDGAVRFVTERILADGPDLMPAYTFAGQPIPDERELRLRGYPGGTARAGNRVIGQFQLDGLRSRWFERNRAACGPVGLYTEEYDVHQGQLRGNLPRAFVHEGCWSAPPGCRPHPQDQGC